MPRTLTAASLVLDPVAYREARPGLRARMIPIRAARRVRLGDRVALEFEDAETLQYQAQEMLAVEGVTDADGVAHELAAYSRLLPTSHSLTATLFVESDDVRTVKAELQALAGLQHAVSLEIGPAEAGGSPVVVPGVEIPGPDEDGPSEVLHAVHFLRFSLDDAARDAFRDPSVPVELVVEHPRYAASTPIEGPTRLRLLADLALDDGA